MQWLGVTATIFIGIMIFIVSQAALKLVIEPVQQLKAAIGLTANTLLRHQDKISNGLENDEISSNLKGHAAELVSKAEVIIGYRLAAMLFRLPSRGNVKKAAQELNVIGYQMMNKRPSAYKIEDRAGSPLSARKNGESVSAIAKLLRVSTTYR